VKKVLLNIMVFSLCSAATVAVAGSERLAREYVEKSNFVESLKAGINQINPRGQNKNLNRLLEEINFKNIENLYSKALARELDDSELNALLQSLSIPGLHSALLKQGKVSAAISDDVFKEINAAGERLGMGSKGGANGQATSGKKGK